MDSTSFQMPNGPVLHKMVSYFLTLKCQCLLHFSFFVALFFLLIIISDFKADLIEHIAYVSLLKCSHPGIIGTDIVESLA